MSDVLTIKELYVEFRSMRGVVRALDGVNLTVREGEMLGLVGESGCGKTVTGLSALGLLPGTNACVTGGEIIFGDVDMLTLTEREMQRLRGARISMVFQDPLAALNPVFTIGDQIEGVIRTHRAVSRRGARQLTMEAMAAVGLSDDPRLLRNYPHELSGGMRQRVCMAMAISCGSQFLIADEPTTALDVTIQAQILQLLLRLREERGVAQLLVTHNVGVAAQTCDRIAVMYAGNVVEQGPTVDIMKNPHHPYTVALWGCLPGGKKAGELVTVPGSVPDLIDPPSGCRFHPRCGFAMAQCETVKPEPVSITSSHWAACHYVAETIGVIETGRPCPI